MSPGREELGGELSPSLVLNLQTSYPVLGEGTSAPLTLALTPVAFCCQAKLFRLCRPLQSRVCPLATCQGTVLLTALCPPLAPSEPGASMLWSRTLQGQLTTAKHEKRYRSLASKLPTGKSDGVSVRRRKEKRGLVCGKPKKSWTTCGWYSQRLWVTMGQT